jgi:hypothetical protein
VHARISASSAAPLPLQDWQISALRIATSMWNPCGKNSMCYVLLAEFHVRFGMRIHDMYTCEECEFQYAHDNMYVFMRTSVYTYVCLYISDSSVSMYVSVVVFAYCMTGMACICLNFFLCMSP